MGRCPFVRQRRSQALPILPHSFKSQYRPTHLAEGLRRARLSPPLARPKDRRVCRSAAVTSVGHGPVERRGPGSTQATSTRHPERPAGWRKAACPIGAGGGPDDDGVLVLACAVPVRPCPPLHATSARSLSAHRHTSPSACRASPGSAGNHQPGHRNHRDSQGLAVCPAGTARTEAGARQAAHTSALAPVARTAVGAHPVPTRPTVPQNDGNWAIAGCTVCLERIPESHLRQPSSTGDLFLSNARSAGSTNPRIARRVVVSLRERCMSCATHFLAAPRSPQGDAGNAPTFGACGQRQ